MISRTIPLLAVLTLAAAPAWAMPAKSPVPAKTAPAKMPAPAKAAAKPSPPVTVEGLLTQAHAAITKGDTELALRLAQSAIVADPARPSSYAALGDIYAEAGQVDYARNFYDAALGIDPAEPAALRGRSALDHGRPGATANAAR